MLFPVEKVISINPVRIWSQKSVGSKSCCNRTVATQYLHQREWFLLLTPDSTQNMIIQQEILMITDTAIFFHMDYNNIEKNVQIASKMKITTCSYKSLLQLYTNILLWEMRWGHSKIPIFHSNAFRQWSDFSK